MRPWVIKRLLGALLTVWASVTLAFFALRIVPGDAIASQLLQGGASEADVAARREALGLDDPLPMQYMNYLAGLVRGDLGRSLLNHQPVSVLIAEQFSATATLAVSALVIALLLGLTLGSVEAIYKPRLAGRMVRIISLLALSTPVYWSGTLAILLFSAGLNLLPATGSSDPAHLILPAAVLGFHVSGSIARVTHASLRQTAEADFIRTARAKGLRARRVFTHHMLRVSLLPVVAVVALQTGFLLGGTVITETLFARQGIGQLLRDAILDQDFPVVQGVVALSATIYSLIGAAADLLYGFLDPRVRVEGEHEENV